MKTIDSVTTQSPPRPRDAGPPPHPRSVGSARPVDGFRRPSATRHSQPSVPAQQTVPEPAIAAGARFSKLPVQKKRRHWAIGIIVAVLASPLLIGLAMLGSLGQLVVVGYVVVALVARLSSHITLVLTLTGFVYMAGLQMAAAQDAAQVMASLAYILLTGGAVALALESRRDSKRRFGRGRRI